MSWRDREDEFIKDYFDGFSDIELARKYGLTPEGATKACKFLRTEEKIPLRRHLKRKKEEQLSSLEESVLKELLQKKSIVDISNILDRSPKTIQVILENLYSKGHNIEVDKSEDTQRFYLSKELRPASIIRIDTKSFFKNRIRFGAISDTHIGSVYERLDALNAIYDIYEKEGIKHVYHGGNIIDGEKDRINRFEIYVHGLEDQVNNFIEKYPQRKGIITHFICGDDHEGWYVKSEKVDVGRYVMLKANQKGRNDLDYLGYGEVDIMFEAEEGNKTWMRLMHGGGGTAYALSYTPQKIVECVPLDSEILTKKGWKAYDEIREGEEVMGFNLDTGRCEWTTLLKINWFKSQKVINWKNDNFEVRCTKNHKWVMEWESRGYYKKKRRHYVKRGVYLWTIGQKKERTRLIQASSCPSGKGIKKDWKILNRDSLVEDVLNMTSSERKAFISGMMVGEGTKTKSDSLQFSQRPGQVNEAFRLACFMEGISTSSKDKGKIWKNIWRPIVNTTLLKKSKRMVDSLRRIGENIEDVWCPTTKLGTWVMKQGGTITITGNSWQGGEKPHILLLGHYHKAEYLYPREVHVIQLGCFQDQSLWMRKTKKQAHVGGWIIEFNQAPDGVVNRFKPEFISFYDRTYQSKGYIFDVDR